MSQWWLLAVPLAAACFFTCGYFFRYCTERIRDLERESE